MSTFKTKALDDIEKGDVILTRLRKVRGGKIDVEIAEIIESTVSSVNQNDDGGFAYQANKSDERFGRSARRAWQGMEPVDAKRLFPHLEEQIKSLEEGEYGDIEEINELNPSPKKNGNPVPLHVEVGETTVPTQYNLGHPDGLQATAKQDGNGNYLLTEEGELIFSNTYVVWKNKEDVNHDFIQHSKATPDFYDGKLSEEGQMRSDIVGDVTREPATEEDTKNLSPEIPEEEGEEAKA